MNNFEINSILMIPPPIVIVAIVLKMPSIPGITLGLLSAAVLAVVYQDASFGEICASAKDGFVCETGVKAVDDLLSNGGLMNMSSSILMTIIAMMFGDIMEGTGQLEVIINRLMRFIKSGVQYGPKTLIENNLSKVLTKTNFVEEMVTIDVPFTSEEEIYRDKKDAKYLRSVVEGNERLAQEVNRTISQDMFPLVIGGSHSLGLGSIAGVSKAFGNENLGVFWVDAHGDFNSDETSPSGNIHGMPLAASAGIGMKELTDLYFDGVKVKPENVFIIGSRDINPGEKILIEKAGVHFYSTEQILKRGAREVTLEALEAVKAAKIENLHLSFDIDIMDPEIIPGTGTRVPNGVSEHEAVAILETIFASGLVRSMDFAEFNPKLDKCDKTLDSCIRILDHIFN